MWHVNYMMSDDGKTLSDVFFSGRAHKDNDFVSKYIWRLQHHFFLELLKQLLKAIFQSVRRMPVSVLFRSFCYMCFYFSACFRDICACTYILSAAHHLNFPSAARLAKSKINFMLNSRWQQK